VTSGLTIVEPFRTQLATVPNDRRVHSNGFAAWAQRLVDEGLAEVSTYFRKRGETLLLPRLLPERVGLVSLFRTTSTHEHRARRVAESTNPARERQLGFRRVRRPPRARYEVYVEANTA
jgi:hypothetical protein